MLDNFYRLIPTCSHTNYLYFIVWDLANQKLTKKIDVIRPADVELFKYKDHQNEIVNYAPEHVLNTPGAKQR